MFWGFKTKEVTLFLRSYSVNLSFLFFILYTTLKELEEKLLPKKDTINLEQKDNLKELKEKSCLPIELLNYNDNKCYLPDDYIFKIKMLEMLLNLLTSRTNLSEDDLKLISVYSSATVIDDEGNFKISEEGYKSFSILKKQLNFHFLNEKPTIEYVLSQIKEKNF